VVCGGPIRILGVVVLAVLVMASVAAADEKEPLIRLWVDSVEFCPDDGQVSIPIHMFNRHVVGGFDMYVVLGMPDIILFDGDEGLAVDTVGTMCSGWELMRTISTGGWTYMRLQGVADQPNPPETTPPIPAKDTGVLLNLVCEVQDFADTLSERNTLVSVANPLFFDTLGTTYEDFWVLDTLVDTTWWDCVEWDGEVCVDSIDVGGPPSDWTTIDTTTEYRLVPAVQAHNGAAYCSWDLRGDVNGDGVGPDVSDLVYLVNYMFKQGDPPPIADRGDVNGDSVGPDVADLVYLVNFMFKEGPEPPCP
jgi:hypothetical protein